MASATTLLLGATTLAILSSTRNIFASAQSSGTVRIDVLGVLPCAQIQETLPEKSFALSPVNQCVQYQTLSAFGPTTKGVSNGWVTQVGENGVGLKLHRYEWANCTGGVSTIEWMGPLDGRCQDSESQQVYLEELLKAIEPPKAPDTSMRPNIAIPIPKPPNPPVSVNYVKDWTIDVKAPGVPTLTLSAFRGAGCEESSRVVSKPLVSTTSTCHRHDESYHLLVGTPSPPPGFSTIDMLPIAYAGVVVRNGVVALGWFVDDACSVYRGSPVMNLLPLNKCTTYVSRTGEYNSLLISVNATETAINVNPSTTNNPGKTTTTVNVNPTAPAAQTGGVPTQKNGGTRVDGVVGGWVGIVCGVVAVVLCARGYVG